MPDDDLNSDLNWLLERHKPGYHEALREQQSVRVHQSDDGYKGPTPEQLGARWFRRNIRGR